MPTNTACVKVQTFPKNHSGAMDATDRPTAGTSALDANNEPSAAPAEKANEVATNGADPVGTSKTLFWLRADVSHVIKANADGSGAITFANTFPLSHPDGIAVDPDGGHVFVLNMGDGFNLGNGRNASLVRYNLDGSGATEILSSGSRSSDGELFDCGKQLSMDDVNKKFYMGDREGEKVWRCDLDGGNLEVLVSGGRGRFGQVVGVAPDPIAGQFYFTDRNGAKILRASMDMPPGRTHADRDDIEVLHVDQAPNAMSLDIALDFEHRILYWTDRQQEMVFSMSMDVPEGENAMTRTDVKLVAAGLTDVIGIAYDHEEGMLYATHLDNVSSFPADGSRGPKVIGKGGFTGIAIARLPQQPFHLG